MREAVELSRTIAAVKPSPMVRTVLKPPSPSGSVFATSLVHATAMRSYRRLTAFSKGRDAP